MENKGVPILAILAVASSAVTQNQLQLRTSPDSLRTRSKVADTSKAASAAQVGTPLLKPLRVQVGVIMWNEFFGHSEGILTAGASYDAWQAPNSDGRLGIYVDQAGYFENHSPYRWAGGGVEYRQPLQTAPGPVGAINPYFGVGVGVYHLDLHDQYHKTATRLGGKAFLGVEAKEGYFVELAYNVLGKLDPRDLSRPSLSVGYKF